MPTGAKKPSRRPVILGVDPSATGTGLAALDLEGNLLSTSRLSSDHTGVERLWTIQNDFAEWKNRLNAQVVHVVMEGYAFNAGKAGSQSHKLGEVGGVLKLCFYELWRAPVGYPSIPVASQVKKYCLGSGTGKKEQMLKGVYKKWGVDLDTNDEADAYTLARIGLGLLRGHGDTAYETDVLKAMEKSMSIWAEMPANLRYEYGAPSAWLQGRQPT